mmetsp:Transcript_20029/g.67893  ORF Transcript_20029/g.67893 Transcript_20029/m.67893 type:complete len:412 (-) Transcript_20029:12-1247(-)
MHTDGPVDEPGGLAPELGRVARRRAIEVEDHVLVEPIRGDEGHGPDHGQHGNAGHVDEAHPECGEHLGVPHRDEKLGAQVEVIQHLLSHDGTAARAQCIQHVLQRPALAEELEHGNGVRANDVHEHVGHERHAGSLVPLRGELVRCVDAQPEEAGNEVRVENEDDKASVDELKPEEPVETRRLEAVEARVPLPRPHELHDLLEDLVEHGHHDTGQEREAVGERRVDQVVAAGAPVVVLVGVGEVGAVAVRDVRIVEHALALLVLRQLREAGGAGRISGLALGAVLVVAREERHEDAEQHEAQADEGSKELAGAAVAAGELEVLPEDGGRFGRGERHDAVVLELEAVGGVPPARPRVREEVQRLEVALLLLEGNVGADGRVLLLGLLAEGARVHALDLLSDALALDHELAHL